MDRLDAILDPEEKRIVDVIRDETRFREELLPHVSRETAGPPSRKLTKDLADDLTRAGVWARLSRFVMPLFVFAFFLVAKADGMGRLIGNAIPLNRQMRRPPTFCLPGLFDVLSLVLRARFLVELDFRNWFYQIPVCRQLQRFFGVRVRGRFFVMRVLLMGWSFAPLVAQTIARAIVRVAVGTWGLVYIDNVLIGAQSRSHMRRLLGRLKWVLSWLCVEVKEWKDRCLEVVVYLGMEIDARRKAWRLSPEWARRAAAFLQQLAEADLRTAAVPLRVWWRAIGILIFAYSATPMALADLTDVIHWASSLAKRLARGHLAWNSPVVPWRGIQQRFLEIAEILRRNDWYFIPKLHSSVTVWSDASKVGGGWVMHMQSGQLVVKAWKWRGRGGALGIFMKELLAAEDALADLLERGVTHTHTSFCRQQSS